jgi:hypothetical protein
MRITPSVSSLCIISLIAAFGCQSGDTGVSPTLRAEPAHILAARAALAVVPTDSGSSVRAAQQAISNILEVASRDSTFLHKIHNGTGSNGAQGLTNDEILVELTNAVMSSQESGPAVSPIRADLQSRQSVIRPDGAPVDCSNFHPTFTINVFWTAVNAAGPSWVTAYSNWATGDLSGLLACMTVVTTKHQTKLSVIVSDGTFPPFEFDHSQNYIPVVSSPLFYTTTDNFTVPGCAAVYASTTHTVTSLLGGTANAYSTDDDQSPCY